MKPAASRISTTMRVILSAVSRLNGTEKAMTRGKPSVIVIRSLMKIREGKWSSDEKSPRATFYRT